MFPFHCLWLADQESAPASARLSRRLIDVPATTLRAALPARQDQIITFVLRRAAERAEESDTAVEASGDLQTGSDKGAVGGLEADVIVAGAVHDYCIAVSGGHGWSNGRQNSPGA